MAHDPTCGASTSKVDTVSVAVNEVEVGFTLTPFGVTSATLAPPMGKITVTLSLLSPVSTGNLFKISLVVTEKVELPRAGSRTAAEKASWKASEISLRELGDA